MFSFFSYLPSFAADQLVVRVGAFNYYPGIFKDVDGAVKGFYVDALADVAKRENIRFEYVYGSWSEGLERIKTGEVDVITSVAYSPERAEFLDYAKTPLLTVWGELYVPLKSRIDGIRAVQGKKIAVMKNDFNARHFIELVDKFDISCEFVELPGFDDIFKAVAAKQVDAGIVNSTFGVAKQKEYGLRSTGVVFNPFDIFFAVAKGKNTALLKHLDYYLNSWRYQADSPFNKARQKWSHGSTGTINVIPRWLIASFAGLSLLALCTSVFVIILRRQVNSKTRAVIETSKQFQIISKRQNAILAAIPDIVMEADSSMVYTWANSAGFEYFGEDVIGKAASLYFAGEQETSQEVQPLFTGTEKNLYIESLQRRKDGEVRLLAWWCKALVDEQGTVTGTLSTARDITEMKQVEASLQSAQDNLQEQNEELQMNEEELRSQNDELQSIGEMLRVQINEYESSQKLLKEREESLQRQNSLFTSLLQILPNGVFMVEAPSGKPLVANEAAYNLLGRGILPDASEENLSNVYRAFKVGTRDPYPTEEMPIILGMTGVTSHINDMEVERPDGTKTHLEIFGTPVTDDKGNIWASLVSFIDITDRKRAEEAIQKRILSLTQPMESGAISFEDLFNIDDVQRLQDEFAKATGVASIITDPDGMPLTSPSNFTRLCNDIIRKTEKGCASCYKSDAVVGRFNPDGPNIQACLSGGLWDAGAGITVGGQHIANWLIGQVRDETQSEEKMAAYAREIGVDETFFLDAFREVPSMSHSQFKHIAQTLFTLATQLSTTAYQNVQQARFINERKQAEEQKNKLEHQLQQAQKMESVGRLAGGVAHDFNNMLGVIMGHAELGLMRLDASHPLCAALKEISKTAARSADLTRQLLAFARKQTVAPKVLDLNESISGMLNMLQRLIGENLHLTWQPVADLWPIKVDPSQIDQILANLCVNARDAIEDTGRVTIETVNCTIDTYYSINHQEALPGEYVRLSVSDDGAGMDKETLTHIFEPFYTTKEIGKGTGLGLATVYGAVKQNNGFINIYSEPGQGSTFSIYLPRDVGSKSRQTITESAAEPLPHGQETILLVEDEPAILDVAFMMLEEQGYAVLKAGTPGEGIRLAREHAGEIHLLMTDVIMPEMNGRDLAKNILSSYPQMKQLFMSGYTADIIAHHGVLDEGVHFIQKPFSLTSMAAMVREVLDS